MRPTDASALLIHSITRAGTAGDRYQGGGKPSPYYTRAWQADSLVYSRPAVLHVL